MKCRGGRPRKLELEPEPAGRGGGRGGRPLEAEESNGAVGNPTSAWSVVAAAGIAPAPCEPNLLLVLPAEAVGGGDREEDARARADATSAARASEPNRCSPPAPPLCLVVRLAPTLRLRALLALSVPPIALAPPKLLLVLVVPLPLLTEPEADASSKPEAEVTTATGSLLAVLKLPLPLLPFLAP